MHLLSGMQGNQVLRQLLGKLVDEAGNQRSETDTSDDAARRFEHANAQYRAEVGARSFVSCKESAVSHMDNASKSRAYPCQRSRSPPLRDDALSHGIEHDLGGAVQIELLHQICPMCLDRR